MFVSDVMVFVQYGKIPLHLASGRSHVDAMRLLVEHGGDVNAIDGVRKLKNSFFECEINICQGNSTVLIFSSLEGKRECFELLMEFRADPLIKGEKVRRSHFDH